MISQFIDVDISEVDNDLMNLMRVEISMHTSYRHIYFEIYILVERRILWKVL